MDDKTKEVVSVFEDYVNRGSMTGTAKEFAEEIVTGNVHKTLQQLMFKCFVACIIKWAECADNSRHDGRNEYTVKLCKEIVDTIGKDKLECIPYI